MHEATEIEKRYAPPTYVNEKNSVDVRITVEGINDEDALALANVLREAVKDAHREYQGDGVTTADV